MLSVRENPLLMQLCERQTELGEAQGILALVEWKLGDGQDGRVDRADGRGSRILWEVADPGAGGFWVGGAPGVTSGFGYRPASGLRGGRRVGLGRPGRHARGDGGDPGAQGGPRGARRNPAKR